MNFLFAEQGINYKLELGRSNHLIVENPNAIDSLVTSLKERVLKQSEAVNIYDGDILDFNKLVQVCFSPVELVFDKKEIQKKLFCDISEIIEAGELSFKLIEAQSIFMEVLERIKIEADYDVDVEEGFGTDFFLKAFNVQLKKPEGSFSDRLIEYILNIHRLLKKRLFIFVGCQAYIALEELAAIVEQLAYEDIFILFIDGYQRTDLSRIENHYIIDKDMCEIH